MNKLRISLMGSLFQEEFLPGTIFIDTMKCVMGNHFGSKGSVQFLSFQSAPLDIFGQ
jgi:hypothetical protein